MIKTESGSATDLKKRFGAYFRHLYGNEQIDKCLDKLRELIDKYQSGIDKHHGNNTGWTEKDSILITYGDVVKDVDRITEPHLSLLDEFLETYIGDTISSVHLLPFFPSSSDAGFSVIDYKKVREDLGDWEDIERLGKHYKLMADLVINHTSRYSKWFRNYKKGQSPGKDYFIEVDPETDLSEVVRPRSTPLLTPVETNRGKKFVWTTFSPDQVDLDFSNPDVLFEFIDIFLFYLSKGIKIVRLDAIAYLWKKIGTKSIHRPQTHKIVKLFRELGDYLAPDVTLITETNVPHKENMSYFGGGEEAHMIYQFSLPPLLLHAILTENADYLRKWSEGMSDTEKGCYFLNFTASHDGIGLRPLEGLVPRKEFNYMLDAARKRGGFVSYKKNKDGTEDPYELNITYFDAFSDLDNGDEELQIKRYICSQAIKFAFKGIPGIYFHNLTGTKNNIGEAIASGQKRVINRKQWEYRELVERLKNEETRTHRVMKRITDMLKVRGEHPAFDPDGDQRIVQTDSSVYALKRISPNREEVILSVNNVTRNEISMDTAELGLQDNGRDGFVNLLGDPEPSTRGQNGKLNLKPFENVWLLLKS